MRGDDDDWLEDEPAERPPRRRNALRPQIVAAIIGAVAVLSAPVIGYLLTRPDGTPPPPLRPSATAIEFVILKPVDGAPVGLKESVSGRTPHVGAKHYVVVTPVATGQPYIQRRANVSDQGTWVGSAQFGEASVGFGEEFIVYAVATMRKLSPGPIDRGLEALAESPHITVRRTRN